MIFGNRPKDVNRRRARFFDPKAGRGFHTPAPFGLPLWDIFEQKKRNFRLILSNWGRQGLIRRKQAPRRNRIRHWESVRFGPWSKGGFCAQLPAQMFQIIAISRRDADQIIGGPRARMHQGPDNRTAVA